MRNAENDNKKVKKKGLVRTSKGGLLTQAQFHELAEVPPEAEWFANIDNPRTRRAYRVDIHEFMGFVGIARPEEFRRVTRAHVLAWRRIILSYFKI